MSVFSLFLGLGLKVQPSRAWQLQRNAVPLVSQQYWDVDVVTRVIIRATILMTAYNLIIPLTILIIAYYPTQDTHNTLTKPHTPLIEPL